MLPQHPQSEWHSLDAGLHLLLHPLVGDESTDHAHPMEEEQRQVSQAQSSVLAKKDQASHSTPPSDQHCGQERLL